MNLPALSDAKARAVVGTVAGVLFVALAVLAARTWGLAVVVALNTALCLLAVWIASGASLRADEAIDEAHQARGPIAPPEVDDECTCLPPPATWGPEPDCAVHGEKLKPTPHPRAIVTPVPPNSVTRISARAHEPATTPIEAQPATVPSNAAIDLGLADIDKWEAQQEAKFEALLADIRGDKP